jgi:hypothetical protein
MLGSCVVLSYHTPMLSVVAPLVHSEKEAGGWAAARWEEERSERPRVSPLSDFDFIRSSSPAAFKAAFSRASTYRSPSGRRDRVDFHLLGVRSQSIVSGGAHQSWAWLTQVHLHGVGSDTGGGISPGQGNLIYINVWWDTFSLH